MEFRDLYDEKKQLTDMKILVGEQIPQGYYYITVVAIIENSMNELLLQINKKYNLWSLTGGHPKNGESSLEGITTEVKEELHIDLNSSEIHLFKTIKTDDDFVDLYYIKKDVDLDNIIMQKEEVAGVKWFACEEIDKLIQNNQMLASHVEFYNIYKEFKEN